MQPDPVQIFGSYTSWKIDPGTWIINFMNGSQNMYLLEGDTHALLIDTSWGAGNLRAYVEKLTDKPLLVAITHGHLDHSGSNGEWSSVYMLPGAKADLTTCEGAPFDISKLPHPDYTCELVKDGDVLDLGNRKIQLLEISSHSNGSLAFLDETYGNLFVGDELESAQVLMYALHHLDEYPFILEDRLRRHHANMQRLAQLQGKWHTLLPAHNGTPISPEYVQDFIELTEHIFAGDAVIEDKLNHVYAEAGDPEHTLCRVRWKVASFFIKKAEMMKLYGSHAL